MKKNLLLILVCLLLSCALGVDDKLNGMWVFEKTESKTKEVYEQSQTEIDLDNLISKYLNNNYLLFEDGNKFNAVLGVGSGIYVNGNWNYNDADSIISLTAAHSKLKLMISSMSLTEIKCSITGLEDFDAKGMVVVFKREGQNLRDSKYNYTLAKFNKWREKATKSEDIEQIMERVKNCLAYSIAYLKYNLDAKNNSVSTTNISLPFNFYANGLALREYDKADDFKNMFFNDGEAQIAYNVIKGVMDEPLNLPDDKSSLEINTIILEHIYKRIK
ncbi:MAG: hypothetical protein EOP00_00865 [Pedobacter sp.]|nr:MAG: hypothetical protein EOP00_00865 [Pedobacter sp.]